VDVIITEDSDLLAYGAKRVLYKLDKFGYGEEIEISGIADCTDYSF
jgi:exonuclease-1